MSLKERDRMKLVHQYVSQPPSSHSLSQAKAAQLCGVSVRQFQRLVRRYRAEGDAGLVHRARGRPSNRKLDDATASQALAILRQPRYHDFGPTLAAEKLAQRHGLKVSRETLRRLMAQAGLWQPRQRRVIAHTQRPRRECFGELVQMDTSIHDWFEGRGETAVLITMIDDATSRVVMRFFPADSTLTNMALLREYFRRQGRPQAIYADRASHFTTTRQASAAEQLAGREAETQIQRALRELDIEYIPARSPQAKGRVERSFGTAQDRLVKELRLADISTIAQANEFLEREFMPWWNRHLTVAPANSTNAHRRIAGHDLAAILSCQTPRTVANDYTVRHANCQYQIERRSIVAGLRRAQVIVEERLDGSVRLRFKGGYLRHQRLEASPDRAVALRSPDGLRLPARSGEARHAPVIPKPDHPWRGRRKTTFLSCTEGDISTLR